MGNRSATRSWSGDRTRWGGSCRGWEGWEGGWGGGGGGVVVVGGEEGEVRKGSEAGLGVGRWGSEGVGREGLACVLYGKGGGGGGEGLLVPHWALCGVSEEGEEGEEGE